MTEFEMQVLVRGNEAVFKAWVKEGQTIDADNRKWNRLCNEVCYLCTGKRVKNLQRYREIHEDWYEVYSWCEKYFNLEQEDD